MRFQNASNIFSPRAAPKYIKSIQRMPVRNPLMLQTAAHATACNTQHQVISKHVQNKKKGTGGCERKLNAAIGAPGSSIG